jgi:hypothetical protein
MPHIRIKLGHKSDIWFLVMCSDKQLKVEIALHNPSSDEDIQNA